MSAAVVGKLGQVLKLEPSNELTFKGPFTQVVTAHLKLSNPESQRVCFKVKTTAPKRYCVRPNSGFIDPQKSVDVAVMLQPFTYDPTEKNKHKFMVQTMFATDNTSDNLEQMWRDITPEKLMDSKLKCVFDMPTDPTTGDTVPSGEESSRNNSPDDNLRRITEVDTLREENKKLKESEVRLRKMAVQDTIRTQVPTESQNLSTNSGLPPIVYMIIAFLVGLIIGKFIL